MPEKTPPLSLIPEQQKERGFARATSFKQKKEPWALSTKVALIVLLLLAGFTVWLYLQNRTLVDREGALNRQLTSMRMERDASFESRLVEVNTLLAAFESILANHRHWTQLFDLIEEYTVQAITFTSFDGKYATGELSLHGIAPDFHTIAEQIKSFEESKYVDYITLSDVEVNEQGSVEFTMDIIFLKSIIN